MRLSVVVPVHNEAENIETLSYEICLQLDVRHDFEIIIVDDGSTDSTRFILENLVHKIPMFRFICHRQRYGQSAALFTGISNALNPVIITLDGDGQNDPRDIERLLKVYETMSERSGNLMVTGYRRLRRDSLLRRFSSRIANAIRSNLLNDETPDTGCGLKIFPRDLFLSLPSFDHMHRFLPALVKRADGEVVSVEISHKPRKFGESHYGTLDRLMPGIIDTMGLIWLLKRPINPEIERIGFRNEH